MSALLEDAEVFLRNADLFFSNVPVKNIYIFSPANVCERIAAFGDSRIIFVDENELCDVKRIRELYSSRTNTGSGRAGWYIQQFIKFAFSRFTKDDYYLIWDGDSIPLRPLNMFSEEGKIYFDMVRTYHHLEYFDTISRILPGVGIPEELKTAKKSSIYKHMPGKTIFFEHTLDRSFITEHMLVRSEYMREMIREIEALGSLEGDNFQERIINAVALKDLPQSGFSEYETYGSYIMARHKGSYILRDYHTLHIGGMFYRDILQIDERNARWLSSKYDAINLNKYHKPRKFAKVIRSKIFQKIFSPGILKLFKLIM